MKRRIVFIIVLLLVVNGTGYARDLLHNATDILTDHIGGDFTLTGPKKKNVTLSQFKGKQVLLYFGYTSCPDVCPMSLSIMQQVMSTLKNDADIVQGLFITVDPGRDNGHRLQQYVQYFHPDFIGLEGNEQQIRAVAKQWGVGFQKQPSTSAAGYLMAHTDYIFLLDHQGELAGLYNSSSKPEEIINAIRQLESENKSLLNKIKSFFNS